MVDAVAGSPAFSIGRVSSMTFAVIGRNLVPFLIVTVIAVLPQEIAAQLFVQSTLVMGKPDPAKFLSAVYWISFFGLELVSVILAFLLQAALMHGTIVDLNGQKVSIGDALSTSLRAFWPLLGLAIVSSMGIGLGLIFLVFPGLMLAMAWAVGVPVLVVEHKGVLDSLSRSGDLTRGSRWPIFGLAAIFYVGAATLGATVKPLMGLSILSPQVPTFSILYVLVDGAVRSMTSLVGSIGIACIYYELRTSKEGIGPQQLASVFD